MSRKIDDKTERLARVKMQITDLVEKKRSMCLHYPAGDIYLIPFEFKKTSGTEIHWRFSDATRNLRTPFGRILEFSMELNLGASREVHPKDASSVETLIIRDDEKGTVAYVVLDDLTFVEAVD